MKFRCWNKCKWQPAELSTVQDLACLQFIYYIRVQFLWGCHLSVTIDLIFSIWPISFQPLICHTRWISECNCTIFHEPIKLAEYLLFMYDAVDDILFSLPKFHAFWVTCTVNSVHWTLNTALSIFFWIFVLVSSLFYLYLTSFLLYNPIKTGLPTNFKTFAKRFSRRKILSAFWCLILTVCLFFCSHSTPFTLKNVDIMTLQLYNCAWMLVIWTFSFKWDQRIKWIKR